MNCKQFRLRPVDLLLLKKVLKMDFVLKDRLLQVKLTEAAIVMQADW